MPIISTALAALGTLGTTLAGTGAAATAAAAGTGATVGGVASTVTALGAVAGLGGTAFQAYEGMKAADAQKEQEAIRKKAADFEFARAKREVIRQTQIQRAVGLNAAGQSGAELASSSAYGGVMGQYANNEAYQLQSIEQNQTLSDQMFASNAKEATAAGRASLFGSGAKFGEVLMNNNMQLGRIGASFINGSKSLFNA